MNIQGKYVILSAIVGSQAYGTANDDSDIDVLGVYLAPTKDIISVDWNKHKETITHTDPDWTYHELGKFISLLIKGNPSVTELLFMNEYEQRSLPGNLILDNKHLFLSKNAIYKSYRRYAAAQMKKYESHTGRFGNEKSARKNARHTLRLTIQACQLLHTGNLSVRLSDEAIMLCKSIEEDAIHRPEVFKNLVDVWLKKIDIAADCTKLPDNPNIDAINNILANIRHDYYWEVPDSNC